MGATVFVHSLLVSIVIKPPNINDCQISSKTKTFAPCEARTHDLQIMRLTRCLLRQRGLKSSSANPPHVPAGTHLRLNTIMSGLNASLGYFLAIVGTSTIGRVLFARWTFLTEFIAAFMLAACRLEVDTIAEVGQWAGSLGPDVAVTMLFISIAVHTVVMQGASGNPSVALMGLLQKDVSVLSAVLGVAAQLFGAYVALLVAGKYWQMELTDMHMIKNLMMSECSTSLQVPPLQGVLAEALGALTFHLVYLVLKNRSQLMQIPIFTVLLTFIAYAGDKYTSGYVNPSLAYAMTFTCPGHTFLAYSLVYWLGPLIGMTLALFLYLGNIPLLFSRNLLYSKKTRFRVPKGKTSEDKTS